jgi:hypothetical protein
VRIRWLGEEELSSKTKKDRKVSRKFFLEGVLSRREN